MKSFEEACEAVLIRKVEKVGDGVPEDMNEAHAKFEEMHKQIQNSTEANMLAAFLVSFGVQNDIPLIALLCVAFSHGVSVGVLMEKAEE